MAEAAGLAIGVVSLAGLCSACLELADYISLTQNLGHDYEVAFTKFLLLKARLTAWGNSLNVFQRGHENPQLRANWSRESEVVQRSLVAIKQLLEDAAGLEQKYGLRNEAKGNAHALTVSLQRPADIDAVEQALDVAVRQRQKRVPLRRKIVWAIRDKKAFGDLISQLAFYVNELEMLAQRLQVSSVQSLSHSLQASPNTPAALPLLEAATEEPDTGALRSKTDVERAAACTNGHLFLRNEIRERARVLHGDVGRFDTAGARHIYSGNEVLGEAKVIYGNASAEVMRDFFEA